MIKRIYTFADLTKHRNNKGNLSIISGYRIEATSPLTRDALDQLTYCKLIRNYILGMCDRLTVINNVPLKTGKKYSLTFYSLPVT